MSDYLLIKKRKFNMIKKVNKEVRNRLSRRYDICNLCIHDDFGYCGLRNEPEDQEFRYNKDIKYIKQCSSFSVDQIYANRMFRLHYR